MSHCREMFLLSVLLLPASGVLAAETPVAERPSPAYDPAERYAELNLEGWPLRVHRDLLDEHPALWSRVEKVLGLQLYQIKRQVPPAAVARLQQVTIWVERFERHHDCMAYHPSRNWLREHEMNPAKARCVEIANAENFLDWTLQQPWMVLHELAHAYHHQFLSDGFKNKDVSAAFARAEAAKIYEQVLRINGKHDRHYAATNPMEYFAEASEAYFGTNDFYPYVRSELAAHDPTLYELLGRLWGERDAPRE